MVAKVAGHLQISVGQIYEQYGKIMHDLSPLKNARIDISHTFESLSFGDYYPGQVNALKGVSFDQRKITKENSKQQPGVLYWPEEHDLYVHSASLSAFSPRVLGHATIRALFHSRIVMEHPMLVVSASSTMKHCACLAAGVYTYFMKVVPTSYTTLGKQTTQSNQYSVTEHFRPQDFETMLMHSTPHGIYMYYDLSAIKVRTA